MTSSAQSSVKPLRIGLLVNSNVVPKYDAEFIDWAATQDDIEVTHLIAHAPQRPNSESNDTQRKSLFTRVRSLLERKGLKATAASLVWHYIYDSEKKLLAKNDPLLRDHLETADVSDRVPGHLSITPIVSPSGFVYRFSESDIEAVKRWIWIC